MYIGLPTVSADGLLACGCSFQSEVVGGSIFPKGGGFAYLQLRDGGPGLRWNETGATRPIEGRELTCPELSKALRSKTQFSQHEWDAFGIRDLRDDDFVKSGDNKYFKPAAETSRFFPVSSKGHVLSLQAHTNACTHSLSRISCLSVSFLSISSPHSFFSLPASPRPCFRPSRAHARARALSPPFPCAVYKCARTLGRAQFPFPGLRLGGF
jgi:hypothetical protein